MTPEQLDEIESRWYIAPDFQLMIAAVREAWAERDRLGVELREVRIELEQVEAERDEAKKKLELKEIELP